MTTIAVNPFSPKNAVIQIDADDYAAAVSSVTMTPSASSVTATHAHNPSWQGVTEGWG